MSLKTLLDSDSNPLQIVHAQVTIPISNQTYVITNDRTAIYYFNPSLPSPITATTYSSFSPSVTTLQCICYGYYNSNHTLFVVSYSGFIYSVILNPITGIPSSSSFLPSSDFYTFKANVVFAPDQNGLYIINNSNSTETLFYDLDTNTWTALTTSGEIFSSISDIQYYNNDLYLTGYFSNIIYKGVLSFSPLSVVYSVYVSGFITPAFMARSAPNDIVYVTSYNTGGTSSFLYKITDFLTAPSASIVTGISTSDINGFYTISLSSDNRRIYVGNYDATISGQLLVLTNDIPCFTAECEILTPNGYVKIMDLKKGQLVVTPDNRYIPIHNLLSIEITTTEETAPYRIPKDFFDKTVPEKDVLISPHHAYMHNGRWTMPIWTPGLQQENINEKIRYYHIQLENYTQDKLVCSGLAVDSWNEDYLI